MSCQDGERIPSRNVNHVYLESQAPAGISGLTYERFALETTDDELGFTNPPRYGIRNVQVENPELIGKEIQLINWQTKKPAQITADTESLQNCLTEEIQKLSSN